MISQMISQKLLKYNWEIAKYQSRNKKWNKNKFKNAKNIRVVHKNNIDYSKIIWINLKLTKNKSYWSKKMNSNHKVNNHKSIKTQIILNKIKKIVNNIKINKMSKINT